MALSSPDSRCAHAQARVTDAISRLLASDRDKLMAEFDATWYSAAGEVGTTDFMYALGDSVAAAVQYGHKALLCSFYNGTLFGAADSDGSGPGLLSTPHAGSDEDEDWALARIFANYTKHAWGPNYFRQCFYNSTCMRDATRSGTAESARSWYFLKCSQLGYLQVGPPKGSLGTRPRQLDLPALLAQCSYIFGDELPLIDEARVATFNAKVGGGAVGGVDRIFEVDFSDDPWKMATTAAAVQRASWPLSLGQPFTLATCDGCAHCGAGAPPERLRAIEEQAAGWLEEWGVIKMKINGTARLRPAR